MAGTLTSNLWNDPTFNLPRLLCVICWASVGCLQNNSDPYRHGRTSLQADPSQRRCGYVSETTPRISRHRLADMRPQDGIGINRLPGDAGCLREMAAKICSTGDGVA
jgi:hypothetical protein